MHLNHIKLEHFFRIKNIGKIYTILIRDFIVVQELIQVYILTRKGFIANQEFPSLMFHINITIGWFDKF